MDRVDRVETERKTQSKCECAMVKVRKLMTFDSLRSDVSLLFTLHSSGNRSGERERVENEHRQRGRGKGAWKVLISLSLI